jgi:hypothetical protein
MIFGMWVHDHKAVCRVPSWPSWDLDRCWFQTRWFLCEFPIGSYVKLSTAVQPSWSEGGTTRHNFGKGPFNDYFIKVWFQLAQWFLRRRFLCEFPIGSWEIPIKIFLSETICSIRTKGWWNSHWMVLFQKYVRRFGPSTKITPTAELSMLN